MTFQSAAADEPRSDKLLVFSMIGIVVLTAIAFGISHFNQQALPSVAPAAAPIQTARKPEPNNSTDNLPRPIQQIPNEDNQPQNASASAPALPQVTEDQQPVGDMGGNRSGPVVNVTSPKNPKIAFARDAIQIN